jgi:flagellar FliL protein
MSDAAELDVPSPPKKSKLPLVLGAALLMVGAGGGFTAVSMGLIGGNDDAQATDHSEEPHSSNEMTEVAFVALDPIIISLLSGPDRRLLRFTAQLDVNPERIDEVEKIKPRIIDILNGYLRALEIEDLEAPAALMKIRSQMLHRVRIVTGKNRINDLLVMEFVLN